MVSRLSLLAHVCAGFRGPSNLVSHCVPLVSHLVSRHVSHLVSHPPTLSPSCLPNVFQLSSTCHPLLSLLVPEVSQFSQLSLRLEFETVTAVGLQSSGSMCCGFVFLCVRGPGASCASFSFRNTDQYGFAKGNLRHLSHSPCK